jgi:hypothetical protein
VSTSHAPLNAKIHCSFPGWLIQHCTGVHYFHPGCEALTDIIFVCYSTLTSNCDGYSMRIPQCAFGYYCAVACYWRRAFGYYCAVACYWRLLYLHINNGLMVTDSELSSMHQVKSLQLEVPPLIAHFLTGFGNATIPSGRDIKFRMWKVSSYCNAGNTSGWFGRVSADTQPFYQNYPCLAVYVARMFATLRVEKTFGGIFLLKFNLSLLEVYVLRLHV